LCRSRSAESGTGEGRPDAGDLTQRLGRQQNFISRIERGMQRVTVIELVEIAEALNFDPMAVVRHIKTTPDA
jgi:hypothetical protein